MGPRRRAEERGAHMKLQTVSFRTPDLMASVCLRLCVKMSALCVCGTRSKSVIFRYTQPHCERLYSIFTLRYIDKD